MCLYARFNWCSVPKKNVGVAADCFNRSVTTVFSVRGRSGTTGNMPECEVCEIPRWDSSK